MQAATYEAVMLRAHQEGQTDVIATMAIRMADAEEALGILRAKGYGKQGVSLAATARLVPVEHISKE